MLEIQCSLEMYRIEPDKDRQENCTKTVDDRKILFPKKRLILRIRMNEMTPERSSIKKKNKNRPLNTLNESTMPLSIKSVMPKLRINTFKGV